MRAGTQNFTIETLDAVASKGCQSLTITIYPLIPSLPPSYIRKNYINNVYFLSFVPLK